MTMFHNIIIFTPNKIRKTMETYNNELDSIAKTSEEIGSKEVYHAYTRNPESIDDSILNQLSDLINGFEHFTEDASDIHGVSIIDILNNAMSVTYIMKESVPVACAILVNPIDENYKGIIPQNYYEMKSGSSLEGMMQQEFFVVKTGYEGKGLAKSLRDELTKISDKMFVVVNAQDEKTITGLETNQYTQVSSFITDWEDAEVSLYIN
jgi:hypothetical protein